MMTTVPVSTPGSPTAEEKREALRAVLQTATFMRSAQLRNFLTFICDMEMAGRGAEISEYLIGVEALGRPPGYSTTDDSTVRRHAHALRQKLEEIYAGDAANANLRIEIPKGSYVPRFVGMQSVAEAPPPYGDAGATPVPPPPPIVPAAHAGWGALAGAFAAGALITLGAVVGLHQGREHVDPVIREAWAPFDRPDANPMIVLSAPPHIGILPYPEEGSLPDEVENLAKETLHDWYRERYPLEAGQRLATHLATGPVRLGEVFALVSAVKVFDRMGVPFQLVAEKNVEVPALVGRNLLLLANPEYSFAAAKALERGVWTVSYDPESRRRIVRPARPDSSEKRTFVVDIGVVYGLITVLPSEGATERGNLKTVVVSCTNAAGCHAAMDFFAAPQDMRLLRERFRKDGYLGFPDAYQVVLKARVHKTQAIDKGEYAAHTSIDLSAAR
jgi:hypothetical protein